MKFLQPILWSAICIAVGMNAGLLQRDALRTWYPYLNKPSLTPPDWVFPVAWMTLYVLMGISIGLLQKPGQPKRASITCIFLLQLALNFLWSVAFFYMRSPGAGLAVISALLLVLLFYAWKSWPLNRISSYLFIPYILWVGFAWYLNVYIYMHN